MAPIRIRLTIVYSIFSLTLLAGLSMWGNKEQRRLDIEQRQLYVNDRRMHLARDIKLAYVHIPKTGGSTIEDSSLFDHKRRLGASPRSHYSVRTLKNAPETQDFVVATHIRNPCERFVSAFLYVRFDDRSRGMRKDAEDFGFFKSKTTEDFVDWLDRTDSWDALKTSMFHFRPMVNWLVHEDKETFGVDILMCQEEWEEGIKRLADKLNIDSITPNLMAQKRVNEAHKMSCNDMEPRYAKKIMSAYALDACLFGYGEFGSTISGLNETVCIGAQYDRSWFSKRLVFCKATLGQSMPDLYG
mmetsp:Transcript_10820/g.17935  ORF Transcript_10820/g.17935 Transcript_10820/m.17935 type:complete len:300 (+) Transcript_10820:92-991(+)|eukprot:CAMPEP_0119013490 /NCGR_PEP_ID=MMETSP1176-20130426/8479_1 /TAXON_ID=265551 /ORGANISM="Synedropsis recta cf, Strain CCMP1620" /LENGTH=299 /DNA_ID=CAMNT_0006966583 /DNA_START=90 /DNA_END=989 /DNA_ORIENTATION=-